MIALFFRSHLLWFCLFATQSLTSDEIRTWENPVTVWGDTFTTSLRALPVTLNDIAVDEAGETQAQFPKLSVPSWVTVGDRGSLYVSTYSAGPFIETRWNKVDVPTESDLMAVHCDQGKWVVAGNGVILYSENKESWSMVHALSGAGFVDIASGHGQWLVVGWGSQSNGAAERPTGWMASSSTGKSWATASYPGFRFNSVTHDGERWLVGGDVMDDSGLTSAILLESSNGQDWSPFELGNFLQPTGSKIQCVSHRKEQWLLGVEKTFSDEKRHTWLFHSEDGVSWSKVFSVPGSISKPVNDGAEWILLNQQEATDIAGPSSIYVYHSSDGKDWSVIEGVSAELIYGTSMASAGQHRFMVGRPGTSSIVSLPRYSQFVRNPPLTILDVEENNGEWVAVGLKGKISISYDGINWNNIQTDIERDIQRIIHRNDAWVALVREGEVWVSHDRHTWEKRLSINDVSLNDIGFGDNKWIVAGNHHQSNSITLFQSSNLTDWEAIELNDAAVSLSLDYGNGIWLLQSDQTVLRSFDGSQWEPLNVRGTQSGWWTDTTDITFGEGKWIFITSDSLNSLGKRYVSTDTENWEITPTSACHGVWYEGGLWWAAYTTRNLFSGRSTWLQNSKDGLTWNWFVDIASAPTDLVIQNNRIFQFGAGTSILSSGVPPSDGQKIAASLADVDFGHQQWLAVANQHMLVSSDGINWIRHAQTPIPSIDKLAYGDGKWGMLGHQQQLQGGTSGTDSVFYTYQFDEGFVERFRLAGRMCRDLLFGFGRWWFVFDKEIYGWNGEPAPVLLYDASENLRSGEFLQGIAFSDKSVMVMSDRGTRIRAERYDTFSEWQVHSGSDASEPSDVRFQVIAWADGQWLMVGGFPFLGNARIQIERSHDGIHWDGISLPVGSAGNIVDLRIARGEGRWMVVGWNQRNAFLETFESDNGVEWKRGESIYSTAAPQSFAFANRQWVLSLENGKVLRSGPVAWLELRKGGREVPIQLQLNGQANHKWILQHSSDLETWEEWQSAITHPYPISIGVPELQASQWMFFKAVDFSDDL